MADQYYERAFQAKMQEAMKRVKLILHAEKKPVAAADCHHQYQDKYLLAECMVSAAVASQLNCLAFLGVSREQLTQLKAWSAAGAAVSLRLEAEETCAFDREETREVEGPKHVEEASIGGRVVSALTSKVVTKVTEYFWKFSVKYELIAFRGVGADAADRIRILGRTGTHELKTSSKSTPRPASKIPACRSDVNVSWLFQKLSDEHLPAFAIRREHAKCHTPRRNVDVASALEHFVEFRRWCQQVQQYMDNVFNVNPELQSASRGGSDAVFVPVLPLLEDERRATADAGAAPAPATVLATLSDAVPADSMVLAVGDVNAFLAEEQRQLEERRQQLQAALPNGELLATAQEAALRLTASHCQDVCLQLGQALDYIEQMLRAQLQAAIGKEVTPADFAEYMCFHSRKLFAAEFLPIPFCFSVRRTNNHSPEGTLSIEQPGGGSGALEPIVTMVGKSPTPEPMSFPLNASAKVTFGGDRYLHAWLQHSFQGSSGPPLSLVARARQFSSFIVLAGRVTSKTTFEPKCAAIVENRDELTIPLEASTIPTPKEFKDAIASLSPEMQDFAKAFRSMQLESTLFGVVLIQIKPQLEKVLNLPEDSLTKEIKLTQQLMRLFIEYQIPSDLLSFDGDSEGFEVTGASATERLAAVREHVEAIYKMIDEAKNEELQDRVQEARFADPFTEELKELACMDGDALEGASRMKKKSMPVRRNAAPAPRMMSAMCAAPPAMAAAPAPSAPSAPSAPTPSPQPPLPQPSQDSLAGGGGAVNVERGGQRDYTDVPKELDARFEKLDADNALRPTIIKPGDVWSKREKKKLLADFSSRSLRGDDQKKEKNAAFDLLDALTKSGGMPVDHASLHVLVAATHSFDKSVMETVVQDNVNPIEKVERSMLIMGSTVHQRSVPELLQGGQQPRVEAASPQLFLADS